MSSKYLTVYTATDHARKHLKNSVQILFTLTPEDNNFSPNSYPAVAWKVLDFDPGNSQKRLTWGGEAGFSIVSRNEDDIISGVRESEIVELKHMVVLNKGPDANVMWQDKQVKRPEAGNRITAFNKSEIPQSLALCAVDNSNSNGPTFSPVVFVEKLRHSQTIECGPPVMLQAYAVSGYRVGQIIKPGDLGRVLLVDPAGDPDPIDIRTLSPGETLRVYSNYAGKVVIERD